METTPAARIQELSRAVRMLAVLGASLKVRAGYNVDPATGDLIEAGADLALASSIAQVSDRDAAQLLVTIEMAFAEGINLLRNPNLAGDWAVDDPEVLRLMGRASSGVFNRILDLALTRPLLQKTLEGRLLDVGTGVGGIALRAAESCPRLFVEAIDPWEPALTLAKQNVTASPHASRIYLSGCDVIDLDPKPRFSLVWLPTMFMTHSVLERAMDRICAASCKGAWLVAAIYTQPPDPFMAIMSTLRTRRSGGDVVDPKGLENMLRSRGYVDIEVDVAPVATFVFGRRP